MTVKRYRAVASAAISLSDSGEYVKYEDYASLQTKVEALAAEAKYLRDAIEDHSHSFGVCPVCSHEEPSKHDDVCYALKHPMPVTDSVLRDRENK